LLLWEKKPQHFSNIIYQKEETIFRTKTGVSAHFIISLCWCSEYLP